MKIASIADVKSQLSAYIKSSAGGPVVVTRNGKPVAVLIGVEDEDEIERLVMAYSPRLRAILDTSRREIAEGKGLSHEEFWAGVETRKPPVPRHRTARKSPRLRKKSKESA